MSNKLIPDPKATANSNDQIYGERLKPYEERMNFFLGQDVKVKKDNVASDKLDSVTGMESALQYFSTQGSISIPGEYDSAVVDGMEAAGSAKRMIDFLIQLAKDTVDFILNLINNRIARLDNREFRISVNRKRDGIVTTPVKYPATHRRLLDPHTVSLDGNWIAVSINSINEYYKATIKTYRELVGLIKDAAGTNFNLETQLNKTMGVIKSNMALSQKGDLYLSEVIPGNRQLIIEEPKVGTLDKIGVYFQSSTVPVKLLSPEFEPSGPMIDNVLNKVRLVSKEIRSNQSTVSQLYRTFEKSAREFEYKTEEKLTSEQRQYLNWLVRFNKRLMTVNLQYVLTATDAGLDFVKASLRP